MDTSTRKRLRITLQGTLQGVGFRPFVSRLARHFLVGGWIQNTPTGVLLEVEGSDGNVTAFYECLQTEGPPAVNILSIHTLNVQEEGTLEFSIRPSRQDGMTRSVIAPDLAICHDCVNEIYDSRSRRFRYPFTTCAQCGPRYSVVTRYPYDRKNTTMNAFPLCQECQREYEDINNRRFHAETMACPTCGPHVSFVNVHGVIESHGDDAVQSACTTIRNGMILAIKGLGGYQLWVNASSEHAVKKLRERKYRPRKPFAVLFPSLTELRHYCLVSAKEEALLRSPESPIVVLERKSTSSLPAIVAPDNPYVGAMLPYTPLHHLLVRELGFPVIATSGNVSDEPLIADDQEALERLCHIADAFLMHDRPIARPVDDSVVRVCSEEQIMIRRARGYVPRALEIAHTTVTKQHFYPVLAVGGHLKNTVAVTTQNQVLVSQHIGDLNSVEAHAQFIRTVTDELRLFNVNPMVIACDLHPDYRSTYYAHQLSKQLQIPVTPIQHHHAHIASCMMEHGVQGPVLGIAWDGAGYGTDGRMWGGEFFHCDYASFERVATLHPFLLPGGETCIREPRRTALSLLYEVFGENVLEFDLPPLQSLGPTLTRTMMSLIRTPLNAPMTSSMGRLFDGISSILGFRHISTFEGEAAMALEFAAGRITQNVEPGPSCFHIPIAINQEKPWIIDWRPSCKELVKSYLNGENPKDIAKDFHDSLVDLVLRVAETVQISTIILTGGVFQNAYLTHVGLRRLRNSGYRVFTHQQYPSNDGGIALGQAVIAQPHDHGHQ